MLNKPSVSLGRSECNDVVLSDIKASRIHARLDLGPDGCRVTDLGSSNGTWFNGRPCSGAVLQPGDAITVGETTIRLAAGPADEAATVFEPEPQADMQTLVVQPTIAMAVNNTSVPRLAVHALGETWEEPLIRDTLSIGREPANDVVINSAAVSRSHARVERRDQRFVLTDLGSTNGTWFKGLRVTEHTLLDGETLEIGPAKLIFKSGFTSEELDDQSTVTMAIGKLPTVVFVPGIMGSELWQGSERLWPNVRALLRNSDDLRFPSRLQLEPRSLLNEIVVVPGLFKIDVYKRLGDYLCDVLGYEHGRDLFEFTYDWRQDNRISARRLAEAVERWNIRGPLVIIAHSMGCLVSRYYIENLGGKRRVSRLIQLGAPQRGGPRSVDLLLTGKGVIPLGLGSDLIRGLVATFPALYQLLPSIDCVFDESGAPIDIFGDESWVADEYRPLLRSARDFHRELPPRSSVSSVCVFGYGLNTPASIRLQRTANGAWQRLELAKEASGDTLIPEASAILPGAEIHPVHQPHGTLFVDNDVKMRLKLELTKLIR